MYSAASVQDTIQKLKRRLSSDQERLRHLEALFANQHLEGEIHNDTVPSIYQSIRIQSQGQRHVHENHDAMDRYIQESDSEVVPSLPKRPSEDIKPISVSKLFKKCQKRIETAENWLDHASREADLQQELVALRSCIEQCLSSLKDELARRHQADHKLNDMICKHLHFLQTDTQLNVQQTLKIEKENDQEPERD
eukprot:jgi/Picsp_1/4054/NSC_01565-R1_---NA---